MAVSSLLANLPDLKRRLYLRVSAVGDCILWMAGKDHNGYGLIRAGGNRKLLAHRAAWIVHFGTIPDGLYVCHSCDVPACINPAHLFLGTHTDNMRDMSTKGRAATGQRNASQFSPQSVPRGEKNGLSKLTNRDVVLIREAAGFMILREMSAMFGVSNAAIVSVVKRKTWTHIA